MAAELRIAPDHLAAARDRYAALAAHFLELDPGTPLETGAVGVAGTLTAASSRHLGQRLRAGMRAYAARVAELSTGVGTALQAAEGADREVMADLHRVAGR